MTDQPADKRQLAAILAADVVGYSAMMEADERETLKRVRDLRSGLLQPKIAEHHGRIFKTMGDGFLVEFTSVVDAVHCAVDIQRAMAARNLDRPKEDKIRLRVGVNLGDVFHEGDDVFGDGVNVAARLEGLAPPGGICVSRAVREQVLEKLNFDFSDLGAHQVKNISRPIEVFAIDFDGAPRAKGKKAKPRRLLVLALIATVLVAAGAAGILWGPKMGRPQPWSPDDRRYSFAVMPLDAIKEDPDAQDYATSLRDALIYDLSRQRYLPKVLSREEATINGPPKAAFMVRGSVHRRASEFEADLVLIDAATGEQLDHQNFTEPAETAHDPIRFAPVQASNQMGRAARNAEIKRSQARAEKDRDARDLIFLSLQAIDRGTKEQTDLAIAFAEQAAGKAPGNLFVLGFLSNQYGNRAENDQSTDKDADLKRALSLSETVLKQDPDNFEALRGKEHYYEASHRYEDALAMLDQQARVNPVFAKGDGNRASDLLALGRAEEALDLLNSWPLPVDVSRESYAVAYLMLGSNAEAASLYREEIAAHPSQYVSETDGQLDLLGLAAAEAWVDSARAARALSDFQAANPSLKTIGDIRKAGLFDDQSPRFVAAVTAGLAKAGMRDR